MEGEKEKRVKTMVLDLESGTAGKTLRLVEKPIGSGKQGSVYIKRGRGKGPDKAVKIFHQSKPETAEAVQRIIEAKFPNNMPICKPEKYFYTKDGRFGYIMNRISDGFVEYKDLLKYLSKRDEYADSIPNLAILCRIGYGLAEIIYSIHEMGWIFPDLSENNFAFHPKTGLVMLFDTDNLRKAEEAAKGKVAIRGTYGSMAPELVLEQSYPDQYSDNFALASVIFQMFMHHYPYDGKAMIEEINDTSYYNWYHGMDPVFAFSEKRRNRVLPNTGHYREMWKRWNMFPESLKTMFRQAFEAGALCPEKRPEPKEWMLLFHELARRIIYCPECKQEMFTDDQYCECPNCKKVNLIQEMVIGNRLQSGKIPIYKNREISPFEIECSSACKREFPFHKAVLPIAKLIEDQGLPYMVNLDKRDKAWICHYGAITQEMVYGDGNLFAENVFIRIPVNRGNWSMTLREYTFSDGDLPF
ncbi:MAG: hypothetical protein IKU20_01920 [Lachnospiraceae bacterium]|nr:hypothetical protein [Lachnospiraceae bacterium]